MPLSPAKSITTTAQPKASKPSQSPQATGSLSPEEAQQRKMDDYRRRVKEAQEEKIRDAAEAAAQKTKAAGTSQIPERPKAEESLSPEEAQRQKDQQKRQQEMEDEWKVWEAEKAAKEFVKGNGVLTPEQTQLLQEKSRARSAKMASSPEEEEPLLPFAVRALGFFIIKKEGEKHDKAQEWNIAHRKERTYLPHLVDISTLNEGFEAEDNGEPGAKDIATENEEEVQEQEAEDSKAQEALVPVPQIPDDCIFDLFKRIIVGDFPWRDLNQAVQASRGWSRGALSQRELRVWNSIYTDVMKARKDEKRLDDLKAHPDGLLFMRVALNDLLTWAMAIDQRWSVVKVDPIFGALNLETLSLFVAHRSEVYEIVLDMSKTRFENYNEKPDEENSEGETNDKPESPTKNAIQGAKDAVSEVKAAAVKSVKKDK